MVVLLIQFLSTDDGGLGVVQGFQRVAMLVVEIAELLTLKIGDVWGDERQVCLSSASMDRVEDSRSHQRSSGHTDTGEGADGVMQVHRRWFSGLGRCWNSFHALSPPERQRSGASARDAGLGP